MDRKQGWAVSVAFIILSWSAILTRFLGPRTFAVVENWDSLEFQ
jgi:hypothetical protein